MIQNSTHPRYALEHPNGIRFCPEKGELIGFPDPESAMLHILEVLPATAHEWRWVPIGVKSDAL